MRKRPLAALCVFAASTAGAEPQTDYLLYCRGCHLADGTGVANANVPSLHGLGRLLATAEGREYIVRVPGVSQTPMDDVALAEVLNWVMAEFNAGVLPENYRPYTADEVRKARRKVLVDPLGTRAKILSGS